MIASSNLADFLPTDIGKSATLRLHADKTDISIEVIRLGIMAQANEEIVDLLKNTERVADKVIQNKSEIIELDKRRQSTREAIRDLGKTTDTKTWITIGPILVKMGKAKALELLKKGGLNHIFSRIECS